MSDQVYDFAAEKSSTFDSLPEDWYTIKVENTEVATSNSGNPMIKITQQITSGDFKNRKVFDNLVFVSNSLWKVKKVLEAAKSPLANQAARIADVADDLKGREFKVYLVPDMTNTGNPTNKTKNYAPLEDVGTAPNSLYK